MGFKMSNKSKKKIAWQKYEDVLEKAKNFFWSKYMKELSLLNGGEDEELLEEFNSSESKGEEDGEEKFSLMPPVSEDYIGEMNLINNYDCWVGYTNFDVTESKKQLMEVVEGVEVLHVISRYRFFIGVGKLFDFGDVRLKIESGLSEEQSDPTNEKIQSRLATILTKFGDIRNVKGSDSFQRSLQQGAKQ
tara:strand:- start:174 stop:743 length:570 start_codon:yes stop_codon:yes gene_type:complete